jgi:mannosyltransferase OCH1-like enzyme
MNVSIHNNAACLSMATAHGIRSSYADAPMNILRADMCKYLAIYKYGGFAIDMDITPLNHLDSWVDRTLDLVLVRESSKLLQNMFVGAAPTHRDIASLIITCAQNLQNLVFDFAKDPHLVHHTVGPSAFTASKHVAQCRIRK